MAIHRCHLYDWTGYERLKNYSSIEFDRIRSMGRQHHRFDCSASVVVVIEHLVGCSDNIERFELHSDIVEMVMVVVVIVAVVASVHRMFAENLQTLAAVRIVPVAKMVLDLCTLYLVAPIQL